MPKSATGTSSKKGFTLLELLVVVLIIGLMLGAVGFSMDSREKQLELEADRLLALLRLAQQETLLTADEIAVAFHSRGYVFLRREKNQWLPAREDLYRPRLLDEELQLTLRFPEDGPNPVSLPSFAWKTETATSADFAAAGHALPRIDFFSGGEITPFELSLALASSARKIMISGTMQGAIALR
ncbi:MAG: type II secretion system protein GspH [Deltaproteobacteria bacterium RIFOXYD12_FULL_55_16]|nr:MAG: type II secretion system protein GspH [Deltaproteobacteria bacterium RIFOXYD12_FULL_55_16]